MHTYASFREFWVVLSERLLTPSEVADRLAIAEHTLAVWRVDRRHLPFIKIGRMVRYSEDEVEAFIERSARYVQRGHSIGP